MGISTGIQVEYKIPALSPKAASTENQCEDIHTEIYLFEKKYFFEHEKNFPQQIQNTREIIQNMSEII